MTHLPLLEVQPLSNEVLMLNLGRDLGLIACFLAPEIGYRLRLLRAVEKKMPAALSFFSLATPNLICSSQMDGSNPTPRGMKIARHMV